MCDQAARKRRMQVCKKNCHIEVAKSDNQIQAISQSITVCLSSFPASNIASANDQMCDQAVQNKSSLMNSTGRGRAFHDLQFIRSLTGGEGGGDVNNYVSFSSKNQQIQLPFFTIIVSHWDKRYLITLISK